MARDPISERFTQRQKQHRLEELSKKARRKEDVQAEEKAIKEAEKVKPLTAAGQPGRNDPCPCGSGKKYKKCCGAAKS